MADLYLASKSPRRKELLERLGVDFKILDVSVSEQPEQGETPETYVCRIALEKARAGQQLAGKDAAVLAADTEVLLDGKILGKPQNMEAAVYMLQSLSGRVHEVYTCVVLLGLKPETVLNRNRLWFRQLSREECENYCLDENPLDKAGGYGIQGRAAGFIERLEGSYSGVMGLPLAETARLLRPGH